MSCTAEDIRAVSESNLAHKEAAFSLGITTETLTAWRRAGRIEPVRPFAPWFYRINDVRTLAGLKTLEVHE